MAGKGLGCSGDIVSRIPDVFFSTSGHFVVPLWSSFQHTLKQVSEGLEGLMEKKRALAGKRKQMQQKKLQVILKQH